MLSLEKIDQLKKTIIIEQLICNADDIHPHEHILEERSNGLESYLKSLHPWIIVPSILVCHKTNVIIDGHHRYYVLKKLNFKQMPITKIDYDNENIATHMIKGRGLSKEDIINTALEKKLLLPKSTLHHLSLNENIMPIIILSDFRVIK